MVDITLTLSSHIIQNSPFCDISLQDIFILNAFYKPLNISFKAHNYGLCIPLVMLSACAYYLAIINYKFLARLWLRVLQVAVIVMQLLHSTYTRGIWNIKWCDSPLYIYILCAYKCIDDTRTMLYSNQERLPLKLPALLDISFPELRLPIHSHGSRVVGLFV